SSPLLGTICFRKGRLLAGLFYFPRAIRWARQVHGLGEATRMRRDSSSGVMRGNFTLHRREISSEKYYRSRPQILLTDLPDTLE
ncbi:hypothetical protein, partial [Burkholderia vietnamiensis]|uniref:hypothetical protein n=1 Tax=Burkholderia vietnamiensis TaxID=60552 RepID=UPI001E5A32FC